MVKTKAYDMKETKKQKYKNSNQGFWARVCMRIHRPADEANCMRMHTLSLCTHVEVRVCKHALKDPNPENKNTETKYNLKQKF